MLRSRIHQAVFYLQKNEFSRRQSTKYVYFKMVIECCKRQLETRFIFHTFCFCCFYFGMCKIYPHRSVSCRLKARAQAMEWAADWNIENDKGSKCWTNPKQKRLNQICTTKCHSFHNLNFHFILNWCISHKNSTASYWKMKKKNGIDFANQGGNECFRTCDESKRVFRNNSSTKQ